MLPLAAEPDLAATFIKLGADLLIGRPSGMRIASAARSNAERLEEHDAGGGLLKGRCFGGGIRQEPAAMPEAVLRAD